MGFARQTWQLTAKNVRVVLFRHWFGTILRAFLLPIFFVTFIAYSKNFFVPPSQFGVGTATPVRGFEDALKASTDGRVTVAFVHNGHTGGQIDKVIGSLAKVVTAAGLKAQILASDNDLLTICRSSLRGASSCYGAASFYSSPTEGPLGAWNYTMRGDGSLGFKIFVNHRDNDHEIYTLPFQRAIDKAINALNDSNSAFPETVNEYPFTTQSVQQRIDFIRKAFMKSIINVLGAVFFLGIIGINYQLTGHMATERELGITQLVEAMIPNRRRWHTQAARLLANHFAFDLIYLPSWIITAITLQALVFTNTSVGLLIIFHLLAGLSLASFSILGASLFRKAQLSGITVTIVSVILAIIVQVIPPHSSGTVAILGLLFPPMTYTFSIIFMARFEAANLPVHLGESAPKNDWALPGGALWFFFILQALLFPVLAAYIERNLYGTSSKARKVSYNPAAGSNAITLNKFSKHYPPGWWHRNVAARFRKRRETVFAVSDFNLSVARGQIFVLLGANGSGKSTTLDSIAGLNKITSGEIEVDGTGGLGLCPQKNVLWDELTVFEHVSIFNNLKTTGKPDTKTQLIELIRGCDLEHKLHEKSKTLSGGQKRKLQLAMMFTGGSRVCCVDEVSSGLDPLSRRKIWDILLRERASRTLLLTTHFLDEADVLADHIAILSKGQLKAEGSAAELKHRLGHGYHVSIGHSPDNKSHKPKVYQLANSAETADFVNRLEKDGITDYQVAGPTIEDVFLQVAEEAKMNTPTSHEKNDLVTKSTVEKPEVIEASPSIQSEENESRFNNSNRSMPEQVAPKALDLIQGQGTSVTKQAWILFRKRLTILKRNYLPYVFAVLIPILTAGFVTLFLKGFQTLSCNPADQANTPDISSFESYLGSLDIPIGPPSRINPSDLKSLLPVFSNASTYHLVNSTSEFNSFVNHHYQNITPGGFFLGDDSTSTPLFAYAADLGVQTAVLTQNVVDNLIGKVEINTQYQEFAVPFAPSAGKSLQLIFYFGLAMIAYPAFFALYPTRERLGKVRALHYSNGVSSASLWSAYLAFDFMFVTLISVIVIIMWIAVSNVWYAPGYLFVVFLLYGLASSLFAYFISLLVGSQLAAFAFFAGIQSLLFLIYFTSYLSIITYLPAFSVDYYILVANFTISAITPAGNLLRGLLLALNEFSVLCRGNPTIEKYPGDIRAYGGPILYLILQSAVLFTAIVWIDSGYQPAMFTRKTAATDDSEEQRGSHGHDQAAGLDRVESMPLGLRAQHITKSFDHVLAVDDLSFAIKHSSVFALLGPNGAGKSTTISLVRGDLRPDTHSGDIFIDDISVTKHRLQARYRLGVCPQFDAIDNLTVDEHLHFYAKARGVPDAQHNVDCVTAAVGLEPYRNRLAHKLSGGNKRKLSLAIALIGNPSVLLLDEPSSGMDAASKRVMWRTLESVSTGRAILVTTHSMEEADRLADRAGIMATKMLANDSVEALRSRFSGVWYVHVVLQGAPNVSEEHVNRVKAWIESNVQGASLDRQIWGGQVRFKAETGQSIATLFRSLEEQREALGLEYYSISQATLDQVFLAIVGQHNVEEEGAAGVTINRGGIGRRIRRILRDA